MSLPVPLNVLEYVRSTDVWNLPERYVDDLRERFPGARFSRPLDDAERDAMLPEADVVLGPGVNAANFARAARLRWVHSLAAGVGGMLFEALVESEVVLTNSRGIHAESMSEHALAVMLAFARRLHVSRDAQRDREWAQDRFFTAASFETLRGSTMVLVGLGAVGGAIATRARALGVRVLAVRRRPSEDPAPADEQWGASDLPRLLPLADWLVLAAPLTPETRGVIGTAELARLRPSARLVNIGRGKLVDQPALIDALASGRLAGAALDVFEDEPLPVSSPLWAMPEVIVTPHVSGLGPDYWGRAMRMFEDNLRRYLDGQPLANIVDKRAGY